MNERPDLLDTPEFLELARRAWMAPLSRAAVEVSQLPAGYQADEVWEALVRLRRAQGYRSPRNMRTTSKSVADWHNVTEQLHRTLFELDRKTRQGSLLDELARARDGRAFVMQQYIEEAICNLRFDGYELEYEDARAVLLGERAVATDAERIAVNFHLLMRVLPKLADERPFDADTLVYFHERLTEGVEGPGTLDDSCGQGRHLPRSPLEEHYVAVTDAAAIDRASLQMPIDVANGLGSEPTRHPIMASMLVNCQFWRAPLFPTCNNLMGCVASRFYLVSEGYPVFRFVPKIRILEKWKQGGYAEAAAFTYREALAEVEHAKDWTLYYDTVMSLMLREVSAMEQTLTRRAARDDEALAAVERIPYLAHRQREVLRQAVLVPGAEFTIAEQKSRYGVVYSTARADLESLVARGLLERVQRGQAYIYKAASTLRENLMALEERRL